jgi:predicted phage terminase large subunit-like protein
MGKNLAAIAEKLTDAQAFELLHDWDIWAREKQREPAGNWRVWLILAGRGFGKTRTGAQWTNKQLDSGKCGRFALVGRTAADVRDVMVEGESGILATSHPRRRPKYEPSKRRLTWPNGAIATTYSADEPDTLRGPQHDGFWADEPAAWKYTDTWDQLMFGLRLGANPRGVATTTPRPTKLIKMLVASSTTHVTRGNTYENRKNLAPAFLEQIIRKYEGTRLGRQELNAEILDDVEGALWQRDSMIEAYRVTKHPPLIRIGVAIDPATTSEEGSAETGIIVGGIAENGHGYILDDCSVHTSPKEWAQAAITAFHMHQADRVIAEVNQGGDMVSTIIRMIDNTVPYHAVRATRGKLTRAEPVSSLYERGLVHHVGAFPELEDQLCSWCQGEKSPDRLDALVWLLTALMLKDEIPLQGDEPQPEPVKVPSLTEIMQSDPFQWATTHGIWGSE